MVVTNCVLSTDLHQSLNAIGTRNDYEIGLLVGQRVGKTDFVVQLIPTPPPPTQQQQQGSKSSSSSRFIGEDWFVEHAEQISRMLPGGISILGTYMYSDEESLKRLDKIRKYVDCASIKQEGNQTEETLFLHIASRTNKLSCRSFGRETGSSERGDAVNIKIQSTIMQQFRRVEFEINTTDIGIPLLLASSNRSSGKPAFSSLKDAIVKYASRRFRERIENGIFLDANGKLFLGRFDTGAGKQKKGSSHVLKFLSNVGPCGGDDLASNIDLSDFNGYKVLGYAKFGGSFHSLCYIHSDVPAQNIEKICKHDMVKTVEDRLKVLFEDYDRAQEDEGKANPFSAALENSININDDDTVYQLPSRIFVPLPLSTTTNEEPLLYFCDYLMPYEEFEDCKLRFQDMLSISLPEGVKDKCLQKEPRTPPQHASASAGAASSRQTATSATMEQQAKRRQLTTVLISALVVLVSALVSILLLVRQQ